jgi:hypothetical protein
MEKKEWSEPELIVLVRSKPEEAVLSVCKTEAILTGDAGLYDGCMRDHATDAVCYSCQAEADS